MDYLRWQLDAQFDRRRGVQTTGKLDLRRLRIVSSNAAEATWYEPVPEVHFRRLMEKLQINLERYVFIDYGSGKGRAMFLAADYPYREVIGVEFSPELHEVAERNIRNYRWQGLRAGSIRSVCIDAVSFELTPVDSVLFFYSPFRASIFEKILA